MEITLIERSKEKKGMIIVYADDYPVLTIPEDDYFRLSLYEKKQITQEEVNQIKEITAFSSAKSSAVRYQLYRLRSSKEVRQKLSREGYNSNIIEKVIDDLEKLGYINDRIYASRYLSDRSKLKVKPKKILKQELQNKGIAEEIIEELLGECKIDEYTMAESIIIKKYGKYDMSDDKIKRKAYMYLLHKGFGSELVYSLISKLSNN